MWGRYILWDGFRNVTEYGMVKTIDILNVYDMLDDQELRGIYSNVICNRIAPHYARYSF